MQWPMWIATLLASIQAVLTATAVAGHDSELGMLAGLMLPFTLLSLGFAVVAWKRPKRKQR